MNIGIIGSSCGDNFLYKLLSDGGTQAEFFCDTRYGPRGGLAREDQLERLKFSLEQLKHCDQIIVPPIMEVFLLCSNSQDLAENQIIIDISKIIPLRTNYVKEFVLPFSKVGKIGLIGYVSHQGILKKYWNNLTQSHIPGIHQSQNKHFQFKFPLFPIKTDHWSILYDLPRSRFVNKLIKTDLKKFKDYSIDTLLPLEYGYFKHKKVFTQMFHKSVRFHQINCPVAGTDH